MKRINVLDKCISELIAAGEVVEKPASVVKELLENSIDAGADKITVEIKNGGISLINISDNGSGIYKEDVRNAFLRHATSKVCTAEDLDSIKTLGFRGEALASICAVSRVEVITACEDEKVGTRYLIEGGEERLFEDSGRARGTTFTVRDLFFNTPARMKFLKKDVAEGNAVSGIVDKIAMSHPEISVKFVRDGKMIMNTPGDGKLSSCIYSVYGKEIFEKMMPVDYELKGVKVSGFVSRPEGARPSRALQNFFINHRYAKIRIASTAIEEAFKGFIMTGKHAVCAIYVDISCGAVDVNVHPSKTEVRFINERPIFEAIYHGVKSALLSNKRKKEIKLEIEESHDTKESTKDKPNHDKTSEVKKLVESENISAADINEESKETPEIFMPKTSAYSNSFFNLRLNDCGVDKHTDTYVPPSKDKAYSDLNLTKKDSEEHFSPIKKTSEPEKSKINEKSFINCKTVEHIDVKQNKAEHIPSLQQVSDKKRILGEAFNCYIMVEKNNKLIFIDKHAAHERIIYNRLKEKEKVTDSQMLLKPVVVYLDKDEYSAIIENLNLLLDSGYNVEDFGEGSIIVRSAPVYLGISDVEDSIIEIAGYILDNRINLDTKYMDWLYHNIACSAAIKGGKMSSDTEILSLVDSLDKNPDVMYCPHGRPVYIELNKKDIEKQFGRI